MTPETADEPLVETVVAELESADSEQFLVDPQRPVLDALAEAGSRLDEVPPIHLLGHSDRLVQLRRDFPLASRLANLTNPTDEASEDAAARGLTLWQTDVDLQRGLLVDDRRLLTVALVGDFVGVSTTVDGSTTTAVARPGDDARARGSVGEDAEPREVVGEDAGAEGPVGSDAGTRGSVSGDAETLVRNVIDECREVRAEAQRRFLETPPLREVLDSCEEALGAEFRRGFERAVAVGQEIPDPTAFHAVRAALLVGAYQCCEQYEVSEWGSQTGLGAEATFSRHKCALEDDSVIQGIAESVSAGGRPRQRLYVTDRAAEVVESDGLPGLIRLGAVRE